MTVETAGPGELGDAGGTPGIQRRVAFSSGDLWAGEALTEPLVASGWHHHGDHETIVYVLEGEVRIETAASQVDCGPGTFIRIPAQTIHRESNPGDRAGRAVVVRSGSGPVVVNVDGPDG